MNELFLLWMLNQETDNKYMNDPNPLLFIFIVVFVVWSPIFIIEMIRVHLLKNKRN